MRRSQVSGSVNVQYRALALAVALFATHCAWSAWSRSEAPAGLAKASVISPLRLIGLRKAGLDFAQVNPEKLIETARAAPAQGGMFLRAAWTP